MEAIVLGSGLGGLMAARVLSQHFDRVTIVEQDQLKSEPDVRRGTPQGPHTHILGPRGYQTLEGWFPGMSELLRERKAPEFDWGEDVALYMGGGWKPREFWGLPSFLCTRWLLEWAVRMRLGALCPNVRIVDNTTVTALRFSGGRVTGVGHQTTRSSEGEGELSCDFMVDSSGVRTKLNEWLTGAGYPAPEQWRVDCAGGVATATFEPPKGEYNRDWTALLLRPVPGKPTQCGLTCIEDGVWRATLASWGSPRPTSDESKFNDYMRDWLSHPIVYETLIRAKRLSKISMYRNLANTWLRADAVDRWPDNLVVMGNALLKLNPKYAQGITITSLAARQLESMLPKWNGPATDGFGMAFQKSLYSIYKPYWSWNVGNDFAFPETHAVGFTPNAHDERVWDAVRQVAKSSGTPEMSKKVFRFIHSLDDPAQVIDGAPVDVKQSFLGRDREDVPTVPFATGGGGEATVAA